jgi:hypothetical protein
MSITPQLYIYSTEGCHLCDIAVGLLIQLINPNDIYIELIDIAEVDNSDEMIEQYGERIPVFSSGDKATELQWPFDINQLAVWLTAEKIV